ncbi:active regulator of SIRT1-like isoform X1 [Pogonomyrmex barbatus]|uniref:Active regulator of SIRT1 n=2 Tax=Pogonomyrmex barbatus TaxID=144034 RepID=A0A6I9WRB4_9HYME|nr:active regulator of SIRT1-like isoform X1 [Pogonomyrmex barbatus]
MLVAVMYGDFYGVRKKVGMTALHHPIRYICRIVRFKEMSNLLVHKSLELLGYEKDLQKEQKKKKKKKRKDIKYKGALDLIPPKHRIISKNDKTDLGTILGRSSKTTVYETQKRLATQTDPTDENVQRLLLLSNNKINPGTTNNLLQRAVGKKYIQQQEKPKKSEKTAFTEEDFKKFEQEYIG